MYMSIKTQTKHSATVSWGSLQRVIWVNVTGESKYTEKERRRQTNWRKRTEFTSSMAMGQEAEKRDIYTNAAGRSLRDWVSNPGEGEVYVYELCSSSEEDLGVDK